MFLHNPRADINNFIAQPMFQDGVQIDEQLLATMNAEAWNDDCCTGLLHGRTNYSYPFAETMVYIRKLRFTPPPTVGRFDK